ncbi:MAG: hypothetical protein J2P30_00540 [Actinobacteria bacterium]|nr:hypothetical protein [Actinomycetota bacterium]
MATETYTLEDAEQEIAGLRSELATLEEDTRFVAAAAVKPSDESRSTQTLANDGDLAITGLLAGTYEFAGNLGFTAGTTGDIQWTWVVSPGATMRYTAVTNTAGAAATSDAKVQWNLGSDTATAGGLPGALVTPVLMGGTLIITADGGSLTLQWARANSDTTATVLKAQSYIRLTRIA